MDSRRRIFDGLQLPNEGICTLATMNAVNDAQPIHRVYVDGFWMDKTDVTNEEFEKFVKATGYMTMAEIAPTRSSFPPRRRKIWWPVPRSSRPRGTRAVG